MRTRFFRCQLPLMMCAGSLPIPLLMCSFWGQGALWPWLIAPAACLLLSCACLLLSGKWRLPAAVVGLMALCAASFQAMRAETLVLRVAQAGLYAALLLYALPMAGWERGREPPMLIPAAGVCAHLFAQMLLFFKPADHAAVSPLLTGSFLVFLLLFMLSLNRQTMNGAMPDGRGVPVSIRRRNRVLTWLLLGLVVLISLIPALGRMLRQAADWLLRAIVAFAHWLASLLPASSPSGGSAAPQDSGMGFAAAQTSQWAKVLEKIFMVLSAVALALLALWALRLAWRRLVRLARWLYGRLRRYASAASEDYVDEVEDTREQGQAQPGMAQRALRRRSARRRLKELPPREQIRARYGLLRGRHPEWEKSRTARETLNEPAAQLYEKARYSSQEITPQDSEAFASSAPER